MFIYVCILTMLFVSFFHQKQLVHRNFYPTLRMDVMSYPVPSVQACNSIPYFFLFVLVFSNERKTEYVMHSHKKGNK